MDLQQFNQIYNENDDFVPNFDLGMDQLMSSLEEEDWETDGREITTTLNHQDDDAAIADAVVPNSLLTDDDIHDFVVNQKSKATKYKDASGVRRLETFMKDTCPTETRKFYELPKTELDKLMSNFFILAKKTSKKPTGQTTDDLYEPDTLTSFRNTWQRVIADKGFKYNIKKDPEFEKSREVLASKRKELTNQGKGNKPNAARALEQSEVNKLYETGFFGTNNAISLQRTVWWKLSLLFGYRGCDESSKLHFGDVKIVWDPTKNKECLRWDTERGTKTRTGATQSHQRAFNPTAFQFDGDRCPVQIFKEYVKRRPVEACTPDSRFFLTPIPVNRLQSTSEKWFYASPMGKNTIGKMMKGVENLIQRVGSRSKVSNHSVRKTSLCRLLQNGVHPIHAAQLSGHKNINSLMSYNVASSDQQEHMSNIINANDTIAPSINQTAATPLSALTTSTLTAAQAECSSSIPTSSASSTVRKRQHPENSALTTTSSKNTIEITSSANLSEGLFRGATIQNVYVFNGPPPVFHLAPQSPPPRKRRMINDLDDE